MTMPTPQYWPPQPPFPQGNFPQGNPPSAAITFPITFFFGIFGLIPAVTHSKKAKVMGRASSPYWLAFGITFAVQVVLGLILVIVMVSATAALVNGASVGSGDDSKITMAEFSRIQNGMSMSEVREIVGGPGELTVDSNVAGMTGQILTFHGDPFGSNANVQFQNGEVIMKSQFGLK